MTLAQRSSQVEVNREDQIRLLDAVCLDKIFDLAANYVGQQHSTLT